jgi:hypothetical protein
MHRGSTTGGREDVLVDPIMKEHKLFTDELHSVFIYGERCFDAVYEAVQGSEQFHDDFFKLVFRACYRDGIKAGATADDISRYFLLFIEQFIDFVSRSISKCLQEYIGQTQSEDGATTINLASWRTNIEIARVVKDNVVEEVTTTGRGGGGRGERSLRGRGRGRG